MEREERDSSLEDRQKEIEGGTLFEREDRSGARGRGPWRSRDQHREREYTSSSSSGGGNSSSSRSSSSSSRKRTGIKGF